MGSFYEVALPYRGLFVKHVGRDTVVGDSNHLIPFRLDECYRVSHPNGGGDRTALLRLSPAGFEEALGYIGTDLRRVWSLPSIPMSPHTALASGRARAAAREWGSESLAADEALVSLLSAITLEMRHTAAGRSTPVDVAPARRRERVLHVIAILGQRYSAALTLAELGQAVGSSSFHLCRIFRAETGRSIHNYLVRLRLNAALGRLLEGEANLSRLAHAVGFSSHAHFTATFRETYGVAPSKVRSMFGGGRLLHRTRR